MKFIDRTRELGRLSALSARRDGGLAVLWGRRRLGKTRLLLEWARLHDGLYTIADQSTAEVQRRYFAEALSARFEGIQEARYPDWAALLKRVAQEAAAAGRRRPKRGRPSGVRPAHGEKAGRHRWRDHRGRPDRSAGPPRRVKAHRTSVRPSVAPRAGLR